VTTQIIIIIIIIIITIIIIIIMIIIIILFACREALAARHEGEGLSAKEMAERLGKTTPEEELKAQAAEIHFQVRTTSVSSGSKQSSF
jgi:heme/copper-type cytochrome/quinol oxidase subunit 2